MSNIGATNSSNIDAQLAAKRAEEERQRAQAAKLAAEQKAKVEAQKAQADAKSAAAQKGKDAQSTKTKAEDVSIHTAQKTDITATQTSAAKASVHTQVAETKTKETTPQETKSSSLNSATKKVDYGEYLSRTITGGKGTSLFDNPSRTEISSGDMVEFSSTTSKFDTNEEFFKKAKENNDAALRKLENEQLRDKIYEQRGLTTDQKEHLYLMLKGDNVASFDSFVNIYKELESGSIHTEEYAKKEWKRDKKAFFELVDKNAIFVSRYIAEAFKKNPELRNEFLNNFENLPAGLQRGYIKMLDNPEFAGEATPEIKSKMHTLLTSDKVTVDTRFYAIMTVLQNKNYDKKSKLELLEKIKSEEVLASLKSLASNSQDEDIKKIIEYVEQIQNKMKTSNDETLVDATDSAAGTTKAIALGQVKDEKTAVEMAQKTVEKMKNPKEQKVFMQTCLMHNDLNTPVGKIVIETVCTCNKVMRDAAETVVIKESQKKETAPEKRKELGEVAGIVAGTSENQQECQERTNRLLEAGVAQTEDGARGFAQGSLRSKKPENTVVMTQCACNNPKFHKAGVDTYISEMPNIEDEKVQSGVFSAVNTGKNTTEEQRVKLPRIMPLLQENNRKKAAQEFLNEKRNTESARVMTAFTAQIPNLGVSIDDKTSFYNQVSAIGNVEQQVMQSTRNQLATQYYELTNRTDFDNFAQTISQNSASANIASTVPVSAVESNYVNSGVTTPSELVKPDKPVGLWGIARSLGGQISAALAEYGIMSGVKPTVAQFVDMLDKEILSAELVVKAGFKDALIQQFSSLSSDAQVAVLGTLTTEEKIMMRKKGLLPRRFWDQVEKQVAQKALEGGDVSNTDAKLLASTASNSVLYQCLNDSSIRLSAQSRSLFQKTLIDNHYLKRDGNGQYKKA